MLHSNKAIKRVVVGTEIGGIRNNQRSGSANLHNALSGNSGHDVGLLNIGFGVISVLGLSLSI